MKQKHRHVSRVPRANFRVITAIKNVTDYRMSEEETGGGGKIMNVGSIECIWK